MSETKHYVRTLLLTAALVLLGAVALQAQVNTGTVLGTVTDASGAPLTGADLTLTNEGTNAILTTITASDGSYKFAPVRIGLYKLLTSFQGFQIVLLRGVIVNVGAAVVVDFHLKPGSIYETIEIKADASQLQTQDASVGQVIDSRSVNNLPLNGRNYTFLAQLAAGVNSAQANARSDALGNAATGAFAANGLRPAQNNYLLDGVDNNSNAVDFLNGTNYVVLPPVDAIQEVSVQTTDFSAEFGRSGAAVLNATIKSGTNRLHGALWEFFRNDALDAADFFENAGGIKKAEHRQNQFGFSVGGPVVLPKLFNGRNKVFFFADYEGLRRRQGTILTGTVPTVAERNSGYTDLSDLINGQSGTVTDVLGRSMPFGTILDPATTRSVPGGFVRDPFGTCPASTITFTLSACGLNQLPADRLDANAIKLLNLYPLPTNGQLFSNFANSPKFKEDRNAFDSRLDVNFSERDMLFFRFSLVDDPQFIPSIFGGVADGGSFQQGDQTALAQQSVLSWTHAFTPTMVNVARAGITYLHTTRVSPAANDLSDIPGKYGIQAVPQLPENGGLPNLGIDGLTALGSFGFLPSDEVSSTIQITDDFTKIYAKHTFKVGFEFQRIKFSTLQPTVSRGAFQYGVYTDIPNLGSGNTGRAEFLLSPIATTVANGVDYVGGPNTLFLSNISLTDNGKDYDGVYINDDWKVRPKLTINFGLRWDFFGLVLEHHGNQANFVPDGPPTNAPVYLMTAKGNTAQLSNSFTALLAQDGIALRATDAYGPGLGRSQYTNFAPRVGFARQITPKLVARAGFGMFYNGFENRGYFPNLGQNYPFQFGFGFFRPDDNHSIVFSDSNGMPCSSSGAGPIGNATLETGFSCTPLDPLLVNASGLQLHGIQFDYVTPYSMGGNLTVQYAVTPSLFWQAAYVTTQARHLEVLAGTNNVAAILPASANADDFKPFKDFARGSSYVATEGNSAYHGLQIKAEKIFVDGLNFLAAYTWSKTRTDAIDNLNGASTFPGGYRGPDVPGFGIRGDYGLANFDIRHVFHFSGGYELPFGKTRRFLSGSGRVTNGLVGGWSLIWSAAVQGGQPITVGCSANATSGTGCNALLRPRKSPTSGPHNVDRFLNAAAFTQPCVLGGSADAPTPILEQPSGCIPLTGLAALGGSPTQVAGPGFGRLDLSIFKDFRFAERFRLQFRSEFFNIFNHPNFNPPGFPGRGNGIATPGSLDFKSPNFGKIDSTRDSPNDPRQIQFALKLYY
jgi:Carboxypeptidase regulatory-like domain